PSLERDVARLNEIDRLFVQYSRRPADALSIEVKRPWFFMPMQWKEEGGVLSRWFGPDEAATPVEYPATEARAVPRTKMQDPLAAIRELLGPVGAGAIAHVPGRFGRAGEASQIHAFLLGIAPGVPVRLHYRMGGPEFAHVEMRQGEEQVYAALRDAVTGRDLNFRGTVDGDAPATVRLHYRRVNQALDWTIAPMRSLGGGAYEGLIPG